MELFSHGRHHPLEDPGGTEKLSASTIFACLGEFEQHTADYDCADQYSSARNLLQTCASHLDNIAGVPLRTLLLRLRPAPTTNRW